MLVRVALTIAYVGLFLGGVNLLGPDLDPAWSLTAVEQQLALPATVVIAVIDLALIGAWVTRARFGGWRLWAAAAVVLYGFKTFLSQLETWWFVLPSHVPPSMLPSLFVMTLPLCLGWTGLVVWALGPRDPPGPALVPSGVPWARVLIAGALVYPVLFFGFGYYVAWQNPALRAYYGGSEVPLPLLTHLTALLAASPLLLPFEMFRGLLWVAIGWPVLRGTRGPWWVGGLLFAGMIALVQNDVHLIPNPVMPGEVRLWHFIETASSNFLFGLATAALVAPRGGQAQH